jgi:hypothetical protein
MYTPVSLAGRAAAAATGPGPGLRPGPSRRTPSPNSGFMLTKLPGRSAYGATEVNY